MPSHLFGTAYGLAGVTFVISLLLIPTIIGTARNITGSYAVPMLIFALINFVGVIIVIALWFLDSGSMHVLSKTANEIDAMLAAKKVEELRTASNLADEEVHRLGSSDVENKQGGMETTRRRKGFGGEEGGVHEGEDTESDGLGSRTGSIELDDYVGAVHGQFFVKHVEVDREQVEEMIAGMTPHLSANESTPLLQGGANPSASRVGYSETKFYT
ncbi:hypothetical protein IQ274_32785 [Nostoc sp. LEGE 12447]|uniref:hypothetical protein n=1 Tax=Nostoc sp. LEGE 12447 TaxID=1828640 RepID=UPI001884795C|nr:hypothetical protein [Nostoc sp. LEGE 12447]MBE9002833.1 hypothetical protein [Nostoc sp. LEGE 12447]